MLKTFFRVSWLVQLILILFCRNVLAGPDLLAYVDKNRVAMGETVQLTLEAAGRVRVEPDTKLLERDFEVLGIASGSNINIVNGKIDSNTTWTLTLSPKRTGTLLVPGLEVNGMRSSPIKITVTESPVGSLSPDKEIFIETTIEPGMPYVQQQAIVRVRLYYGSELKEGSLGKPEIADAIVRQLGEDATFQSERNGKRYSVLERKYLVSFQKSGDHLVKGIVFAGKVIDYSGRRRDPFGSFFSHDFFAGLEATKRVRIRGEEISVHVLPRPATMPGSSWLPAKSMQLSEEWSPDKEEFKIGDPITRTITIVAEGLTGEQLPDPAAEEIDGFRVYPDKADVSLVEKDATIVGKRIRNIAYIPSKPGVLTLPAIQVAWWDVEEKKAKVASLPARTVTVLEAVGKEQRHNDKTEAPSVFKWPETVKNKITKADLSPKTSATANPVSAGNLGWPVLFACLLVGWIITLVLLWLERRKKSGPADDNTEDYHCLLNESKVLSRLRKACENNDPQAARQYLLRWGALLWPENAPAGLDDLGVRFSDDPAWLDQVSAPQPQPNMKIVDKHSCLDRRFADKQFVLELQRLDRVLYGGLEEGKWDGRPLARLIRILAGHKNINRETDNSSLPPLYS